jgi:hypothetical protein
MSTIELPSARKERMSRMVRSSTVFGASVRPSAARE